MDVPEYEFSFLSHSNLDQIESQLKTIPNSVLVLTTIGGFQDKEGKVLRSRTLMDIPQEHIDNPSGERILHISMEGIKQQRYSKLWHPTFRSAT